MRQADDPGLINLAAGVPGIDALPSAALREALAQAFEKEGDSMFAYHHPEGDPGLRELLAARLRQRGADVRSGEVFTTTGCQQGLQLMLEVLARPGDVVACEVPAYYALLELIAARGCSILPLPVRGPESFDLDEVDALLERWRPKCVFICTTLSNPTGATIPEPNRPRFVEICRRHGVRIVEDDIYAELTADRVPPPLRAFDDGSTVSYVSSFSKSAAPGLRAGVCVPGTVYEAAAARKVQQDMHSTVMSEIALRNFLKAGAFEPHLVWLRERNQRRRSLALTAIERFFPSGAKPWCQRGGYMIWVEFSGRIDFAKAREMARKDRVVFAAGDVFFPTPPERSYVRLNCAKAVEDDLARGIEVLGRAFRESAIDR